MLGRTRKVRFSEDEPLKCRHVNIPWGPDNQLSLFIEATHEELDTLQQIITQLSLPSIRLRSLPTHTIKQFIEQTKRLLELDCIKNHQENILTSIRHAFFHVLHQRPYHPNTQEIESLDVKLALINFELNQMGAINTYSVLTRPKTPEPYDPSLPQLPQTLPEFMRSIDVTMPERLYAWEEHLSTLPINTLRTYLEKITASIQELTDEDEVMTILNQLNKFITFLNKSTYRLQHNMFKDIESHGNRSPLRSPQDVCNKRLKDQLNQLMAPVHSKHDHFNHDFYVFRQKISLAKNTPYVQLDRLIKSLNTYLLDQLEKNIGHASTRITTLRRYLSQRQDRIAHPLPDHLQTKLDKLLQLYDVEHNHSESLQKHYKHLFLTTLRDTIHRNPEKTYAECYRLTESTAKFAVDGLRADSRHLTLFGKHRFKHFIAELLNAEPDYEQSVPRQNTHHVREDCASQRI
ncbi:MAG: hypothetical protein P1U36_08650 [Legionellaceae bacterium]|nr:hypothetical protein [Legionellaceae bacterium]